MDIKYASMNALLACSFVCHPNQGHLGNARNSVIELILLEVTLRVLLMYAFVVDDRFEACSLCNDSGRVGDCS